MKKLSKSVKKQDIQDIDWMFEALGWEKWKPKKKKQESAL